MKFPIKQIIFYFANFIFYEVLFIIVKTKIIYTFILLKSVQL